MSDDCLYIRCDCDSPEHMLIFDVWHWDERHPSDFIIRFGLDPYLPWWRRLFYAGQYVLTGKTQRYWWAESIVKRDQVEEMRDFINRFLASADTHAKRGDAKQSPSDRMGSVVGNAETPNPQFPNPK